MRVQRRAVSIEFDEVRHISDWPHDWINTTKPGDILLLPGHWGQQAGMLRLTRNGTFISVTADQVFGSELIAWPDNRTPILGIKLVGTSVNIVSKK